jgi:hypothetical protein
MKCALLLVISFAACAAGKSSSKDHSAGSTGGSESAMSTMKPGNAKPAGPFVKGAPLTPAKDLVAWFDAQTRNGEPRLTRVPIVLKRGDVGFSSRGARIGGSAKALEVYVSDTALGIGIASRALKCAGDTCPFLVEGYWRGNEDGTYHYEIRNASREPISPDELAAITHAEVEGESGN